MNLTCEFCKKIYTSLSSLNYHKKTAKFCLELQKENLNNKIQIEYYNCEYCEKNFTIKNHLISHLSSCNIKKFNDKYGIEKEELIEEFKKEKEKLIEEFKKEKDEMVQKYIELKFELKLKDEKIKDKDVLINKYECIIKEKDNIIKENNDRLTNELLNRPQIINHNNTTSSNYTVQFNKLKDDILPFTDDNIRDCINSINSSQLIYYNNNDVMFNFISNFVNAIKVLAFCTDSSRGCLVIKDEEGKHTKIMANEFIVDCIKKSKRECINILDRAKQFIDNESEEGNLDDIEYSNCLSILTMIKGHINQDKKSELTKNISTSLIKHTKQLTKNKLINE